VGKEKEENEVDLPKKRKTATVTYVMTD